MADDQTFHDSIEGYCGRLSYGPGDVVDLHVSTEASAYDVLVERSGIELERVWSASQVAGVYTEVPADADSEGCGWPTSIEIPVDGSWRSGFYLITLTGHGVDADRATAHAGFVVRAGEESTNQTLWVLPTNTWNAYNTWGGRSLYTGGAKVSFARPFGRGILWRPEVDRDDRKARPARWGEEPDADGRIFQDYRTANSYPSAIGSTGWFTHGRRFAQWAEQAGYELDYATSSDLEDDPTLLDRYRLVLSVGHDEYWSARQRQAVEAHLERGGHLISFSGNTMFWQVRLEASEHGLAMVCHKYRAHLDDPVVADGRPHEATGMWADPSIGQPEWSILGAGSAFGLYHRFGNATARGVGGFVIYRPGHWLLEGTGLSYGDVLGAAEGVVGYETLGCPLTFDDRHQPVAADRPALDGLLPPESIEIIAFVPSSNLGVGDYPASIAALNDQGDLEFIAERIYGDTSDDNLDRVRFGNAVLLTCRPFGTDGGEVVTVGTTDWVFGLATDRAVGQLTANAIDRLG